MPERLLEFVLSRCSKYPNAEFWKLELDQEFSAEVEQMVGARWLQPVPTVVGKQLFPCPTSTACEAPGREVVESCGKIWATCTCPAEEPPHELAREDLQKYLFAVERFAGAIATKNSLRGALTQLDPRLWFLGDSVAEGQTVAWVMALFYDEAESISLLESLLTRLPASYVHIVVLAHQIVLPPHDVIRLNGLGVFVRSIPLDVSLQLPLEDLGALSARRAGDVATWPENLFKDEDGTWLTARILQDRFSIPNSRLKNWREQSCPNLDDQKLAARKIPSVGWVYFRTHVNQIANRRDDKGRVESKLDIEARLDSASRLKRQKAEPSIRDDSR